MNKKIPYNLGRDKIIFFLQFVDQAYIFFFIAARTKVILTRKYWLHKYV